LLTKSGISTITVQLPEDLAESLRREVLPPDKVVIKALEEWLEKRRQEQAEEAEREKGAAKSEREQVMEAIESTGLVEPMGAGWEHLISKAPRMNHDKLQLIMAGKPSLSELIIAERNEGR
jgi:Arc/MetJ-type ribon-helix-helix transcriptional regulator